MLKEASIYQEKFWLSWKSKPLDSQHNETLGFEIQSNLNIPLLKKSLESLAKKHVFLKSTFIEKNRGLFYETTKTPNIHLNIIVDENMNLDQLINETSTTPFDLEKAPPWRATLLKKSENCFLLLLTFHHIIVDGNIFSALVSELSENYNHDQGEQDDLDDQGNINRAIQDQNTILSTSTYQVKHTDNGKIIPNEKLGLAFHNSGKKISSILLPLPLGDVKKILALKEKYNVSKFTVISTLFSVLIYKHFGQETFTMDYPVNMRAATTHQADLIGSMINICKLSQHITKHTSFESLLKSSANSIHASKKSRSPYKGTLKTQELQNSYENTNLVISETSLSKHYLTLKDVKTNTVIINKTSTPYDFNISYETNKEEISFLIQSKGSWLSDTNSNEMLANHINTLLEVFASQPSLPIKNIDLIQPENKIISKRLHESQYFQINKNTISQEFILIAKKFPNKIAIIDGDNKISYRNLLMKAKKASSNLLKIFGCNTHIIGLHMQHSIELIIAMLGVFLAGGTYVPLNPTFPKKFLTQLSGKAGITHVISDSPEKSKEITHVETIAFNKLQETVETTPIIKTRANSTAYIIFTSGTTGLAKGVPVEHKSVVNLIHSVKKHFNISSNDVVALYHSYSFDFSVWEIWSALLNGATLAIIDSKAINSPAALSESIAKFKISILNQTPTALKLWSNYLLNNDAMKFNLDSIRLLISGGEALYPNDVEFILNSKSFEKCKIFNMYGITEDGIHSTIHQITQKYLNQSSSIIGSILSGKKAIIVDKDLNEQPDGISGELLLSGFGLANEYFNNKNATKEKFVTLTQTGDTIWLKTGDFVRTLPSGELEYLGRKDALLKINGYRVNCREITSVMNSVRGVINSYITAIEEILVAFVVLDVRTNLSLVKSDAAKDLPNYMRPRFYLCINEMPKTINGKTNHKELVDIYLAHKNNGDFPTKIDQNKILIVINEIWDDLLHKKLQDTSMNFFDCGGNSTLVHELQWKLEENFLVNIPTIDLFKNPTIGKLAQYIFDKKSL